MRDAETAALEDGRGSARQSAVEGGGYVYANNAIGAENGGFGGQRCCVCAYAGSVLVPNMSSAAPALHLELHKQFIHHLDRAKDSYEFAVTDQLRMSGAILNLRTCAFWSSNDYFRRWLLGTVCNGGHGQHQGHES